MLDRARNALVDAVALVRARAPQILFAIAILLLLCAVLTELGSMALLGRAGTAVAAKDLPRPGLAIPAGATLDLALLYSLLILAANMIAPVRVAFGRVHGIATFLLALSGLLASIALVLAAIALLTLMVTMLMAFPFGTIVYLITWGHFDKASARALLAAAMDLKLIGLLALWASSPMLIRNKGLVLLIACSLGVTFLLGFLIALPPGFLVSITDAIGAIVAGIVAAVWMVIFLVGSVPALVQSVRSLIPKPV